MPRRSPSPQQNSYTSSSHQALSDIFFGPLQSPIGYLVCRKQVYDLIDTCGCPAYTIDAHQVHLSHTPSLGGVREARAEKQKARGSPFPPSHTRTTEVKYIFILDIDTSPACILASCVYQGIHISTGASYISSSCVVRAFAVCFVSRIQSWLELCVG